MAATFARDTAAQTGGGARELQERGHVWLACVPEGGKLRVRIVRGAGFPTGVNCQFPRHLRTPGAIYQVPESALRLISSGGRTPYYRVDARCALLVDAELDTLAGEERQGVVAGAPEAVFDASADDGVCAICLDLPCCVVCAPCGHLFMCSSCAPRVHQCAICRSDVVSKIPRSELS